MRVPNQNRRSTNQVFVSSQDKSDIIASLRLQKEEETTPSNSIVQFLIWMLTLPAITLILYLLS